MSVGFKPWLRLFKVYTNNDFPTSESTESTRSRGLTSLAPLRFTPTHKTKTTAPLAEEVSLIAQKNGTPLEDAELTALRGRVLDLNKQQLQQLSAELNRALPKSHTAAVRALGVFKGQATVDKIMTIISGSPDRLGRLSPELRGAIRQAREASVRALLNRCALNIVNGNRGLFKRINPTDESVPMAGDTLDTVTQRYLLLEMVSRLLQVGVPEEEVLAFAEHDSFEKAIKAGYERAEKREQKFAMLARPQDMDNETANNVATQLSLVRWLENTLREAAPAFVIDRIKGYTSDLQNLFFSENTEEVEEHLDARFENIIGTGFKLLLETEGSPQLDTVSIERHAADRPKTQVDIKAQQLDDHPVHQQLSLLESRFKRGERSAVGIDYALQTFPEDVLQRAASGELKVVAFDGAQKNGVKYIRNKYGMKEDGLRMGTRVVGLQALYGSYPRSLVVLDDGQQFLLVSGYGASRQLNNAATVMLYEDEEGRRLSASNIDLACDHTDLKGVFKRDIQAAILEDGTGHDQDTPTRLMILQNPRHLEQFLGDKLQWGRPPKDSLVPFQIAYRTFDDGSRERLIIPKVGGGGLYGDTAGVFMESFFDTGLKNLIPDVIFNGAAGGFAGSNGLPQVAPGGLFMPTKHVEQDGDGLGPQPIPSRLGPAPAQWPADVKAALSDSEVHLTESHIAVMAPAIETFAMIDEIVSRGHASIDVEAGALMAKARELGKTCTVLYTHSDDPRASAEDPNASLGRVAPFLEGSRYPPQLFSALDAIWGHSRSRSKSR